MTNTILAQKAQKSTSGFEYNSEHDIQSNLFTINNIFDTDNTETYQNNTILVQKVQESTEFDKKAQKNTIIFECKLCRFVSYNKNHYNRHLNTNKHKKRQDNIENNFSEEINDDKYYCKCGKSYKHKPNFYSHRKKCEQEKLEENDDENNKLVELDKKNIDYKDLFFKMLDKNDNLNQLFIQQLQNQIEEQNKIINEKDKTIHELIPKNGVQNGGHNVLQNSVQNSIQNCSNNTNNNSNNNMNINLFLNENCKEALSIDEFIKKIEITVNDLLFTKQKGFANGISNIFMRHLTDLPERKRPLWCIDKKRKKIYIKEHNWSEDVNNHKTKKAIKEVSCIQVKNIKKYIDKNPDWKERDNKKEEYLSIVRQATMDVIEKETDIINKLVNGIYLDNESKREIEG